jgi:AcrR family transcriptional regulator
MSGAKGSNYGGVSAVVRQEERRRRLLAAGLEVIGARGWSSATVRAVCREANLSSRFFYESFASVEELAVQLLDDLFEQAAVAVAAALDSAPRDPRIRNRVAIETFVHALTDDRRVARLAFVESLGNEALTTRRLAMVRTAVDAVLRQVGVHGPAGVSTTYRRVAATVLIGGLAELLVGWMHDEIDADLDRIVEDYVRLVLEVGDVTYGKSRVSTSA